MKAENGSLGTIDESELVKELIHDIKIARHLIENPEYFYQQPTTEQENKFKEEYLNKWKHLSKKNRTKIPKTIDTFFGKVEFIRDAVHFKNLLIKYILPNYKSGEITFLKEGSQLSIGRKEMYEKLDSLSQEELTVLQAKNTKTPLQIIDFSTGKLSPVTL